MQEFFSAPAQLRWRTTSVALKGYDPVAYFTEKRPMVGNSQYQHEWDGAIYRFASAKHLELFKAEPDRYLPQYNNWCAASVAKGEKVSGNPEWWLVVDGRLYLFGKPIGPGLMSRSSGHEEPGGQKLVESLTPADPAAAGLHAGAGEHNSRPTSRPPSAPPVDTRGERGP